MQPLQCFASALIGGAVLTFTAGCRDQEPVIVLDRRGSFTGVESECSVPEKLGNSCIQLGKTEVGTYVTLIGAAFAADPRCHGISLLESARTTDEISAAEANAPWKLEVDWRMGVDGEKSTYTWWLFHGRGLEAIPGPSGTDAKMTPASTIHNVCEIVRGVGGKLLDSKGLSSF